MSGQRPLSRRVRRGVAPPGAAGSRLPPRRRAPVPVAGAVEALAAALEPVTPLAAIQRAWPETVGPAIAAECEPVGERGGVVTVVCRSSVWAHELSLMAPEITARLNAALGDAAVSELRCRAA